MTGRSVNSVIEGTKTMASTSVKSLESTLALIMQNQIRPDICAYCGIKVSAINLGANDPQRRFSCPNCKYSVYCSAKHKEADQCRHQSLCKNISQKARTTMTLDSSKSDVSSGGESAYSTATSAATASIAGGDGGHGHASSSIIVKEDRQNSSNGMTTNDPEIQVVATINRPPSPSKTTSSSRKRALNSSANGSNGVAAGVVYKDHSKNPLFKATLQDHMRSLAASGLALNQHQAIALRLRYLAEHVIRGLNEYGWAVCDNFLGETHCSYTYREVERLYHRGLFTDGQLMDQDESSQLKDIRSDQIYWFNSSDQRAADSVTVRLLLSMIDSVIVHFRDRIPPYNISGRSRAMIACYPGNGTRYVKHVDNPVRDGRCITAIYYCNANWKLAEHGGTLRLYPESSQVPMDIDPQADRLVFFWSDRRNPHEVLPVYRHRYAITIWYFDQCEKNEAIERKKNQEASAAAHAESSNPLRSKASSSSLSQGGWNSRPSAFKTVTTTAFVPPSGATAADQMRHVKSTNSDSFSTGSGDDALDDVDDTVNPDEVIYQI